MNKHALERCVESLILIRTQKHGKLSSSVIKELDQIIETMMLLLKSDQDEIEIAPETISKGIEMLGKAIKSLGWIHDLIEQFWE